MGGGGEGVAAFFFGSLQALVSAGSIEGGGGRGGK